MNGTWDIKCSQCGEDELFLQLRPKSRYVITCRPCVLDTDITYFQEQLIEAWQSGLQEITIAPPHDKYITISFGLSAL